MYNALPAVNSYRPMPSLSTTTDALDARPRGAIEATDAANNVYQYAGDAAKLYELSSGSWGDVSKIGGYATGSAERWEFVRWRETVIATNFSDNPQVITFGGANFADLTTALRFKHIAVVGAFVVAGHTFDGTDGTVRDRVRWSAINDSTDWTVSPVTLSDFRDLKGEGIQQIIGGEYGVILTEDSTYRMTFVGTPTVFQIDEVVPGVGLIAPGAAATLNGVTYYPSEHGFVALSGGTNPSYPGAGKVDQWFRDDIDEDHLDRISVSSDPRSGGIFWSYPGSGNTAGRPNRIIVYDTKLNRWSLINQDLELIWRSGGVATTLEGLDAITTNLDALGVSLDSSQWKGSAPLLSGFDSSFMSGNFSGASMDATLLTKEVEMHSGSRTQLNGFVPLVDGGTVTARIRTRNRQADGASFGSVLTQNSTGRFSTRSSNAKYHAFELSLTGDWTDAIGVQVDPQDARKAQGRG
jgi:hypothetical protein